MPTRIKLKDDRFALGRGPVHLRGRRGARPGRPATSIISLDPLPGRRRRAARGGPFGWACAWSRPRRWRPWPFDLPRLAVVALALPEVPRRAGLYARAPAARALQVRGRDARRRATSCASRRLHGPLRLRRLRAGRRLHPGRVGARRAPLPPRLPARRGPIARRPSREREA